MKSAKPFLFLFVFVISCKGPSSLISLSNNKSCSTSLEGSFEVTDKLPMNESLIGIRIIGREFEYLKGKIIEITEEGVMFDESRRSPTSDPKPTFYENRRIYTLTDSLGYLIKGEFPDDTFITKNLTLYFSRKDTVENDLYKIELKDGEDFGFCIEPGEYLIKDFIWTRKNKDSDRTRFSSEIRFHINENKVNYLGKIHLNNNDIKTDKELVLPIVINYRTEQSVMSTNFGLIGVLLTEASLDRGIISNIKLNFEYEQAFLSRFGSDADSLHIFSLRSSAA